MKGTMFMEEQIKNNNREWSSRQRNTVEVYFRKVDAGEFDKTYYSLFTEDVELYFPKFGFAIGKEGIQRFGETMSGSPNLIWQILQRVRI